MTTFRPTSDEADRLALEDVPHADLTTEALGIADRRARIGFTARDPLVVAGIGIAEALIARAGGRVERFVEDGAAAAPGTVLLTATGSAGALHRTWKQAQTTVEILSGVASAAREMVEAVAATGRSVPVACTRKAFPGGRRMLAAAIRAGGCVVHRHGLSETVLVFAEHRAFLPDEPLAGLVARLRAAAPEKKLVIEVATPDEALAAARAGFDVVQTEKFSPADLAATVAMVKAEHPTAVIAAAGGIHPGNVGAHVAAGADVIVTSWPYGARPRDVAVTLSPDRDG